MTLVHSINILNNHNREAIYTNKHYNQTFQGSKNIETFKGNNNVGEETSKTIMLAVGVSAACLAGYTAGKVHVAKTFKKLLTEAIKKDAKYIKQLATDMSKTLKRVVKPEQLSSVMGKNELMAVLPKYKKENFAAFKEIIKDGKVCREFIDKNISNGIFRIDLHSHTNHSDGQAKVADLLENVVNYANKLYEQTGKKFIFSITDHDVISGTQKALDIISSNPEKYKNLRFVPGVELSFLHYTDKGEFQVSEMLAHCINPFSKKTTDFIESLLNKRGKILSSVISDLNKNSDIQYSLSEIQGNFINLKHCNFKYNLLYSIYNYAQIKQRLSALAKKWGKDPQQIYNEIMPQWHIPAHAKCAETFEKFMESRLVDLSNTYKTTNNIENIFSKYFPHFENKKVVSSSERTFEELIEHFSENEDAILGFAHPAFLTQYYANPKFAIEYFLRKGKNLIKTTEAYHQAYYIPLAKEQLTQKEIDATYNLLKLGGHDNHKAMLLD